MPTNEIQECKLASEKRWTELRLDIQKLSDKQDDITKRLDRQEAIVQQIQEISKSTAVLASNMQSMLDEQKKQSARLAKLEEKPAKRWESIIEKVIGVIVGGVVGYALFKLGIGV